MAFGHFVDRRKRRRCPARAGESIGDFFPVSHTVLWLEYRLWGPSIRGFRAAAGDGALTHLLQVETLSAPRTAASRGNFGVQVRPELRTRWHAFDELIGA